MPVPGPDCENYLRRHLANPFLVLELAPEAGRSELERQGARLLAMLAAGLAAAGTYATPLGPRERTAEMVRQALAELRDPARRLVHEWWAQGLAGRIPTPRRRFPRPPE
ncbi:MAG TPA: hypothetical protein VH394_11940 [Thermoanaerobaculia bacterium]|jgi:hypothetical protein|nr:hypothetical protein [Thermoanaerobaculia bacterium]